jgi:hypothetical protein
VEVNDNMGWVRATYGNDPEQVQESVILGNVDLIDRNTHRVVFRIRQSGRYIITFANQKDILDHLVKNVGGVFALKFLKPTNNKFVYTVKLDDGEVDALTVAGALLLMPPPKELHITPSSSVEIY